MTVVDATPVRVVAVATDGSGTAAQAVVWAATLAGAHAARLHVVQVLPDGASSAECERSAATLTEHAQVLAPGATATVVAGDAIAELIVAAAEEVDADVLVVGNSGMRGRKEFLLGNVANRVTHLARCTVTVVNTAVLDEDDETGEDGDGLDGRAREIARVLGPAVVRGLAGRALHRPRDLAAPQRLREAFEELGPTFGKLGQILSTRPDLVAPEYVEELRSLQSSVPPMSEAEVVAMMEQELGVPWEDVFGTIDPQPLAAGTIGQVHRATLADGRRVVVKVQRPGAASLIDKDLVLLGRVTSPLARANRVRRVIDLPSVVDQLGSSLRSELDFRQEAENLDRMAVSLERYDRLAVPTCHHKLSTARLLVMDEVPGVPLADAPPGPERSAAARQLLRAFYQQVLEEGFFHADPHPGNLMWADGTIWLLDLGMVGRLDADTRQQLMLLLLAFAQGDGAMLAELALDLAGGGPPDLDRNAYEAALGELAAGLQGRALDEISFADLLNRLTDLSMRFGVPLPSSLVLVGKAVGQVQMTVAEIAPELDPLAEAAHFFSRSLVRRLVNRIDPQELLYQAEKLRYRATRVAEDFTGSRHAPPAAVAIERSLAHAGRTVALGLTVGLSWIAVASSDTVARTTTVHRLAQLVATASTAALAVEVAGRGPRLPWRR
jgi:predicted unusual protein kinase regulating ubiquinone biosynthesis (AarF/ABC1/UbiB family)/nucleotide-binding universal stress UspA family protein